MILENEKKIDKAFLTFSHPLPLSTLWPSSCPGLLGPALSPSLLPLSPPLPSHRVGFCPDAVPVPPLPSSLTALTRLGQHSLGPFPLGHRSSLSLPLSSLGPIRQPSIVSRLASLARALSPSLTTRLSLSPADNLAPLVIFISHLGS